MKRSRAIAGAAALAVAGIATMASATSATAAPKAAAYNGACGSGYSVVNSVPVTGKGTVYLTYSAKTGKNCVVTVRNSPGKRVSMYTYITATDGSSDWVYDSGQYTSYAGPVYLPGKGICVDWGGSIESVSVSVSGSNCGRMAAGVVTHH
ncbi:spore-associated protein A [Streptomyces tubercidicus]|uniref:Spore-associated protein A n=1 Tax=Streptomyces tubercidicus TaxID=47759 RepID=A0A640UJI6_9ACTN|nr:spore-associated protein A [Streptomyces tubercidicus]WAU10391.1 spore-associated protein A [Streptomyces tubercidicus]WSK33351.1 spore-associated protein A [Streptomyces tubercidicus]WSX24370.1 spore-associated protein A [Streptomyces tubercidicus]GFE35484.1 spore-associated protein A [Streptomyces tubercidicus]